MSKGAWRRLQSFFDLPESEGELVQKILSRLGRGFGEDVLRVMLGESLSTLGLKVFRSMEDLEKLSVTLIGRGGTHAFSGRFIKLLILKRYTYKTAA